ncbi:Serine/threonine-protein [Carex littledalei]|uniref:Serine/threonine-protein n=1 Tax=Carex littledalei TaxID=544730 RepID=A0A833RH36_9POAL|nr:Serine/threonine-protein [Carex littledalei]
MPHAQHKVALLSDNDYTGVDVRHHRSVIPCDPRCDPFLCSLGLYQIARMDDMNIDKGLLAGLVERWRPETHTFHLLVGEMTVTLQDVSCLWGLPIKGAPVTGFADTNARALVEHFLGAGSADAVLKRRRDRTENPGEPTDEQVHQYTRAYILDLFGTLLFADSSGDSVPVMYLQFLGNLDEPVQYNWGGAVLALLYRNLCVAVERRTQTMCPAIGRCGAVAMNIIKLTIGLDLATFEASCRILKIIGKMGILQSDVGPGAISVASTSSG